MTGFKANAMAVQRRKRIFLRTIVLILTILGIFGTNCFYQNASSIFRNSNDDFGTTKQPSASHELNSLFLTEDQCREKYPGLFKEIDDSVARGPFALERAPDDYSGLVQGRIKAGKLYIISAAHEVAEEKIWWRTSTLHALHRAITTSHEALPDTYFSLVINDSPRAGSWSFSRSHSSPPVNSWLMPHFSFWSWPLHFIRSMDEALSAIEEVERKFTGENGGRWAKKVNKVVWRGTSWFNGIGIPDLRPKLLEATKGKDWANVEALDWTGIGMARNSIGIEEFCGYRYIAYTEGVTYSGRLQLHLACASVILTPPIAHLQHTSHLIRPLFSSSLPLKLASNNQQAWTPSSDTNATWPIHYDALEANLIFVAPDWSDLEAVITYLSDNMHLAEGIARRQRQLFVDGGFLSQGAEACYWRGLVRGWSKVVTVKEEGKGGWGKEEGMRWETFALTGKTSWKS